MMENIILWLQSVDWRSVGALLLVILTNIGLIITWLKKNISNFKALKDDSTLTNNSINYAKANLKSNKLITDQIGGLNNEIRNLGKLVNDLNNKLEKLERSGEESKDGI